MRIFILSVVDSNTYEYKFEPWPLLCVSAAVPYHLSYEDLQWFLAVGINLIKTLKTC